MKIVVDYTGKETSQQAVKPKKLPDKQTIVPEELPAKQKTKLAAAEKLIKNKTSAYLPQKQKEKMLPADTENTNGSLENEDITSPDKQKQGNTITPPVSITETGQYNDEDILLLLIILLIMTGKN